MSALAVGDACEVAGSAADGFAAAWFTGRVTRVIRPSARTAVSDELQISYPDFVRPDGSPELEQHPARSHRVRPPQPAPAAPPTLAEYQVGAGAGWRLVGAGRRRAGGVVEGQQHPGSRSLAPTPRPLPARLQLGDAVDAQVDNVW